MEGSQEEGSATLGRGGKSTAGPATMTSLDSNNEERRCREGNEVRRVGRDQPQWQAGPW